MQYSCRCHLKYMSIAFRKTCRTTFNSTFIKDTKSTVSHQSGISSRLLERTPRKNCINKLVNKKFDASKYILRQALTKGDNAFESCGFLKFFFLNLAEEYAG